MQWLIDLIKEVIFDDAGFFPMPEKGANDFSIGDFTKDSLWHDFSFAGIVPDGSRAVAVSLDCATTSANKQIRFRWKTNITAERVSGTRTQVGGRQMRESFVLPLDADLVASYNVQTATWSSLNLNVIGYWKY